MVVGTPLLSHDRKQGRARKKKEMKEVPITVPDGDVFQTAFFLVLDTSSTLTQEMVTSCKGRLRCFNCTRPIEGQVYMYPVERNSDTGHLVCNPLPHCRPGCALRSVYSSRNVHTLLTLFVLMYGDDVRCAPPREFLFLSGGMSLDEYHGQPPQSVWQLEDGNITRTFLAPVYVSHAVTQDYKLAPNARVAIEQHADRKSVLTLYHPNKTGPTDHTARDLEQDDNEDVVDFSDPARSDEDDDL